MQFLSILAIDASIVFIRMVVLLYRVFYLGVDEV
jgi:hypothetical protein